MMCCVPVTLTYIYMDESFQDYLWIKDFEADFPYQPHNAELEKYNRYSLSEENWPFKLEIVNT